MKDLFKLILGVLASLLKSRAKLEAEILILRQQINVLRRRAPKRPHLNNTDRFCLFGFITGSPPSLAPQSGFARLISPMSVRNSAETFGLPTRLRDRQRQYARNPARCQRMIVSGLTIAIAAPHVHGELLKLGFEVAQSTVARYMCHHSRPPFQGWRTFLSNHFDGIAAVELFVFPTIAFRILYCLVIIRHGRRIWVSFGVTENPTAEWISRQITEAFP
jgi:hypothetical protein